jgi:predicted RND superfamily exporter protein
MWQKIGELVLRYRLPLLIMLFAVTGVMGYYASKVKMSYEFAKSIPIDNPKYKEYLAFKQKFGEDGNLLAIGFQTDKLFTPEQFNRLAKFHDTLKRISGVADVLSVVSAINLVKNDSTEKLQTKLIFPRPITSQSELDSCRDIFLSLPFYKGLMYNPDTKAYLVGVRIENDVLNKKRRDTVVAAIEKTAAAFEAESKLEIMYSGLPHIRYNLMTRIGAEM